MEPKPASTIQIVRIINKESNPMVGLINPIGRAGMICWDPEHRKFNPHDQVLVDPVTHNIVGDQSK